jgi:predicted thioesterase
MREGFGDLAADTAAALGNTGVEVISTPAIIGYLEMTCHLLIEPLF